MFLAQQQELKNSLKNKDQELLAYSEEQHIHKLTLRDIKLKMESLQVEKKELAEINSIILEENKTLHLECTQLKSAFSAQKDLIDKWFSEKLDFQTNI